MRWKCDSHSGELKGNELSLVEVFSSMTSSEIIAILRGAESFRN